jgi:hypothetical protein
MRKQFRETSEKTSQRRITHASAYSARVQEAMRYDKIPSAVYPLVMTLLDAVLEDHTEERWKEEQQRTLKTLLSQPVDQRTSHKDAANRYEQIVGILKDLELWPW